MSLRAALIAFTGAVFMLMARGTWTPNTVRAEDVSSKWPAFQNGGSLNLKQLPKSWNSDGTNIQWQVKLVGYGQSSPVVFESTVYITSTSGPNKDDYHLSAYSLKDGSSLWSLSFKNPSPIENNNYVSRAAPTPAADSQGVIATYEGGLIVAVSHDGKIRWQRDLVAEFGSITSRHGLAASLEQDAKRVFVWIERDKEPYILALRKDTGDVDWQSEGLGATSWSSPRLITVAGQPQLICSASGHIAGIDPNSGKRLWSFKEISNNTTCTPIPVGDGLFIIGSSDGRGEQSSGSKVAESNGLIKVEPKPDGTYQVAYVWRAKRATCSFGSPVVGKNFVWMVNRSGALYKLDLQNGNEVSVERTSAGSIWATPIVTADSLYLFGQKGTTAVINLDDSKETAASKLWDAGQEVAALGGRVLYAAAVADNTLLLRSGDTLYAIR